MRLIRALSLASLDLYRELARLPGLEFAFREPGSMTVYLTREAFEHGIQEAGGASHGAGAPSRRVRRHLLPGGRSPRAGPLREGTGPIAGHARGRAQDGD